MELDVLTVDVPERAQTFLETVGGPVGEHADPLRRRLPARLGHGGARADTDDRGEKCAPVHYLASAIEVFAGMATDFGAAELHPQDLRHRAGAGAPARGPRPGSHPRQGQ